MTVALLLTSTATAFAKPEKNEKKNNQKITQQQNNKIKEQKQEFKIDQSPVIKYGKYKLPINPVTKGMGATVTFDKSTAVLTVVRGNQTIIINFKTNTVTVNGVIDTKSGIFTAKNDKKTTVLIKYIAKVLGVRVDVDKDKVEIVVPGLDLPTNVTVTPVGTVVKANTLNSTTQYMTATANIKAGQATGGKAELYVGNKLVATDNYIAATDTTVTFTTSDNTPTNAKLQAAVPTGGVVTVRLYNANNKYVTSAVANPTLVVDYVSPTITGITSAIYNVAGNKLSLNVTGAGAIGDLVDVTKISLYDYALGRTYQLTDTSGIGSTGVVKSANSLEINLGTADKLGLAGFGSGTMYLSIAVGSLLKDVAGNTSPSFASIQTVPVIAALDLPTNVTVTPIGTTVIANTLNSTTLYMNASANIIAGQATGGKAELYVGSKLVATDSVIEATDTVVTFTTSDNTPTNAELQAAVPTGGVVTVRLYNANNKYVTSAVANPTLVVDYVTPTITGITSAIYDVAGNRLYLNVNGAGDIGDAIDVTKLSLYDSKLGKTYQLTNASGTGSTGVVQSATSLLINIGSTDKRGLTGFGSSNSTVYLTVAVGSLITDAAGNASPIFTTVQTVPVTVIN